MARVILEGLVKRFGSVAAVDGASLEIAAGELACVLGPPGAGKSTLVRLIAGLERVDDGEIYLDDRMVQALPPRDRNIAMIFPDLALWPALTVQEHVAYPLKRRGVPGPERRRRVGETLTMLRIDSLANRRPDVLTRHQAFRAALARAVVAPPELLILDEPIEQFDPRARDEIWDEVRHLRAELGLAMLVTTRSVPEALAVADRLAVMDLGRILQSGAPGELYNHPADAFVARFLGPTNLLQGQIDGNGSGEGRREAVVRTPLGRLVARGVLPGLPQGAAVTVSIRPETLSLGSTPPDWNRFPATIERIIFRGEVRQVDLRGPSDWPVSARLLQSSLVGLREGQSLTLSVAPEHVALLPGKFSVGKA